MRILQVIPVFSDPFGGPVTVVRSISKELAKRHDVIVYTTTALDPKHDSNPRKEEVNGYKVIYFSRALRPLCYSGLFGQLNISLAMMKALTKNLKNFDIVHLHSWQQFPDIVVHYYATKYRVPYVLQVHGSLPRIITKQRLKLLYDIFFGYRLLRDASKVIALSSVEAEQYKNMEVPDEKIAVIPNGIDLAEYDNLPPKGFFKKKLSISDKQKTILYLGRIHKSKRIDILVKAYAYMTQNMDCKDSTLVIVGSDDGYLNELKSLVASLGISKSVTFTGFISNKDRLEALADADVFVTPSFYGFPMTFLEACATGTPIVTTTLGDRLEWIHNNVGYATSPRYLDVAKAICTLISDSKVHKKFSRNCRTVVEFEFSLENVVTKLEKVYQEVAKR